MAGPDALAAHATTLLREANQRVTKPRVVLLSRIIAAGGAHLSADALHDQVDDCDPPIHRATVYRTLEGLTSAGVLRHVHLDRGITAYHLVDPPRLSSRHSSDEHLH